MSNAIRDLLVSLGIVREDTIENYFPHVRDRKDIAVLRCRHSGVIFLSSSDHISLQYYEDRRLTSPGKGQVQLDGKEKAVVKLANATVMTPRLDDSLRREQDFGRHLVGKRWLDVGAGSARLFDRLSSTCRSVMGVEPNAQLRADAVARGHAVFRCLEDIPEDKQFDIITLFHVFEHLVDPIGTLGRIRQLLVPGGMVLIEVPHARDFLLETADCEAFRKFTLWSEHLVLHTRTSLEAVIRAAGFKAVEVKGYQRYSLANHLYWVRHGKPGGHEKWGFLDNTQVHEAWADLLQSINQTDTLIAVAHV